ncbi:hypothetical protein QCN27_15705 [Cereibacter sp. SYSU M97828]|nr:hypothetical protein [Cereibacter flavus]
MTPAEMRRKIREAIDAAWPAGMSLDAEQFQREIDSRLDAIAVAFMATRPDLASKSLDDWLAEHHDRLSNDERRAALCLLDAYSPV